MKTRTVRWLVTLVYPVLSVILCVAAPFGIATAAETAPVNNGSGFVTQSQGKVSFQAPGGKEQPLPAFVRLAKGALVKMDAASRVQIIYLQGGRQETWAGKATLEVGDSGSKIVGTASEPVVKVLQPFLVETLLKSGEVMGNIHARQGMIRVRSLMTAKKVREAEDQYIELRAQAAEDDITPEIFLLTTLDGLKAYQSMKKPLGEMLRRQPDNAEAKALHDHFMLLFNEGAVEVQARDKAAGG